MEQRKEATIEDMINTLKIIYEQTAEAKSKVRSKEDKDALDVFLKNIDFTVSLLENPIFEKNDVNFEIERMTEETIATSMIRAWSARLIIDERCY